MHIFALTIQILCQKISLRSKKMGQTKTGGNSKFCFVSTILQKDQPCVGTRLFFLISGKKGINFRVGRIKFFALLSIIESATRV